MDLLKYLASKKIYLLINLIILGIGFYLIDKGLYSKNSTSANSHIYVSIGTSLIATGIVIFLDLWKNFSISNIFGRIKNIINEGGVEHLYKKRDIDRYDSLMTNLSYSLDICGYSLGGFFDSFSQILIEKLGKSKIAVRIIIVKPNSEASKFRAEIEGKSPLLFEERIKTLKNFFNGISGIEIREIEYPLSTMIFKIDDVMFVGPHFHKKQSKSTLTMELQKGKWMFDEYQSEFDRMWNNSNNI